ncbi:MAG: cell division protein FtsA [Alphaproteobacteria bacterium]|nr:MAG: cell division protein FtsA [Alphaproteobacteria bacterium]|tara:strand:- start:1060 stop:2334 length:1275 start_codon:yes stop_codon:yes gene_type:complete
MVKSNLINYSSFSKSPIIAALDIGSSKICCLIAKIDKNETLSIIGAGFQESKGLVSGVITDMIALENSIRNCVASAEKMASVRIKNIIVGFSSDNINIENLNIEIDLKGAVIGQRDLNRAYNFLSEKHDMGNRSILHVIPFQYSIDGNKGVKNPIGMIGDKLGVEISIISSDSNTLKNLENVVKHCDLEIDEIVYTPYASGISLLSEEEKELGVALIDMGSTLTTVSIFYNGSILYTKSIPLGGNMVTNDVSRIFSLSFANAERIKIINGQLIEELENSLSTIEVDTLGEDNESIEITRKDLISVIKPRIFEIVNTINDIIIDSKYNNIIANRFVITGGASQMEGLLDFTSKVFGKKARLAKSIQINALPENMKSPSFSAISSMVKYSITKNNDINMKLTKKNNNSDSIYAYVQKFKNWFIENF